MLQVQFHDPREFIGELARSKSLPVSLPRTKGKRKPRSRVPGEPVRISRVQRLMGGNCRVTLMASHRIGDVLLRLEEHIGDCHATDADEREKLANSALEAHIDLGRKVQELGLETRGGYIV